LAESLPFNASGVMPSGMMPLDLDDKHKAIAESPSELPAA
jgi:hypothetical protein